MTERIKVYLKTGNIAYSDTGSEIKTVLGSCVCVCLWDFDLKKGAMNHFLLPKWVGRGLPTPKYGNVAMESLYEKMITNGSRIENMVAKVFGGARLVSGYKSFIHPGELNIEEALSFLRKTGIPVIAKDTGGNKGRTVIFRTDTGEVFVRKN